MRRDITENASVEYMAMAYMLCAVLGYSLTPLIVVVAGGDSPFMFNAGWRLGLVVGFASFGVLLYRNLLSSVEARNHIASRLKSPAILATALSNSDYAFFALAATLVHISAATMIFETWPLWMILMLAYAHRKSGRYRPNLRLTAVMILLCLLGLSFVVGSQSSALFGNVAGEYSGTAMLGSILALVGALVGSFAAFSFKWSTDVSEELLEIESLDEVGARFGEVGRQKFLELFCLIVAYGVSSSMSVLVSLVVGIIRGESTTFGLLVVAFVGGVVTYAPATIAWRMGNLQATNLGVNAVIYGTPVLSLLWLFLLSLATMPLLSEFFDFNIVRVDYLVIGVLSIIVANLLINFEAEIEFGFKALILALWTCGAVVYLRPEEWVWVGSEGYFGVLGLSATLFTLILAFRVSRFVDRTSYEDNTMYSIFHSLDLLARRGVVAGQVRENMMSLDAARNIEDTYAAYGDLKLNLQSAQSTAQTPDDQQTLSQTEASLDSVIHSKQRGNNFGEFFALIVFAVITVAMALLARPEQSGWTGFLVEMFTFPFCAVIVFLTVNAWDVHRDWLAAVFSRDPESGWYGVLIRDESSRDFEQWISVVIGLAATATYAFLLWDKWLG